VQIDISSLIKFGISPAAALREGWPWGADQSNILISNSKKLHDFAPILTILMAKQKKLKGVKSAF
jgi:hypothetical protein